MYVYALQSQWCDMWKTQNENRQYATKIVLKLLNVSVLPSNAESKIDKAESQDSIPSIPKLITGKLLPKLAIFSTDGCFYPSFSCQSHRCNTANLIISMWGAMLCHLLETTQLSQTDRPVLNFIGIQWSTTGSIIFSDVTQQLFGCDSFICDQMIH